MENYNQLKERHQKEFNEFPIGFAFDKKQFKEQMEKLGLTENDTDKIASIGGGGFIRKTDISRFLEMLERHTKETKDAMLNDEFLYTAFRYELNNHEYCYTHDPAATFQSLGLKAEDVENDPRISKIFERAKKDYLHNCSY